MHETENESFAVMAVVYSRNPECVLLIRNVHPTSKHPHEWKFIGESSEPGESHQETLVRALWAEGGFRLTEDDPEVHIEEVRPVIDAPGKTVHKQYFFKVRLPYLRLRDLGGKKFPGDDPTELFETKVLPFQAVDGLPSFFRAHRSLFNQFLGYPA